MYNYLPTQNLQLVVSKASPQIHSTQPGRYHPTTCHAQTRRPEPCTSHACLSRSPVRRHAIHIGAPSRQTRLGPEWLRAERTYQAATGWGPKMIL